VLGCTSVVVEVIWSRAAVIRDAQRDAVALAGMLTADLQTTIRTAEGALRNLAAAAAEGSDASARDFDSLDRRLTYLARTLDGIERTAILPAGAAVPDGRSTGPGGPRGRAAVDGRAWHIRQPITAPGGARLGIAVAAIDPGFFAPLSRVMDLRPDAMLLLAHRDGTVIAHHPPGGAAFELQTLFRRHVGDTEPGSFRSSLQGGDTVRIIGYRPLTDLGLVVAVVIDQSAALAAWWDETVAHVGGLVLFVGLLVAILLYLIRRLRQEQALLDHHAEYRRRLGQRAAQQQAVTALSQVAVDGQPVTEFLHRTVELLGRTLQADRTEILRIGPSGTRMELAAAYGPGTVGEPGALVPIVPDSLVAICIDDDRPMISGKGIREPATLPEHVVASGAQGGIAVPIRIDGSPYGALCAYSASPDRLEPEDVLFLESVAHTIDAFFERERDTGLRAAVLNGMPANICLIDETGTIVLVNQAWQDFADRNGYADPRPWTEINYLGVCAAAAETDSDDAQRMLESLRAVLAARSDGFSLDYCMETPDRTLWFRALVEPLTVDQARGAVIMHLDITEQHQAEERLRDAHRLEALGQLTGGVAHDFNNLLTVILGNAQLLDEDLQDQPEPLQSVRTLRRAAERGAELTARLLSYARRQRLRPHAVATGPMLQEFMALLGRTVREDVVVELDVAPDVHAVHVDPTQLETALLNLVVNARDAIDGSGRITIRAGNHDWADLAVPDDIEIDTGAAGVTLSVGDTGEGMPDAVKRRAFEPFFTTKQAGHGTGLGLSMVFGFARQSGGFLSLESTPGAGTTVSIHLPAAAGPVGGESSDDIGPQDLGNGRRVLLVEDDEMVRDHLTGLLRAQGFEVALAASAGEALDRLAQSPPPDLILSDVIMPGPLTGFDLARRLTGQRPEVAVILMTGYADPARLSGLSGFDHTVPVLQKPFSRGELEREIAAALARRNQGGVENGPVPPG